MEKEVFQEKGVICQGQSYKRSWLMQSRLTSRATQPQHTSARELFCPGEVGEPECEDITESNSFLSTEMTVIRFVSRKN